MFDFDMGKLLLIGVVALIFIPPKDLPEALRQMGRLVGKARRMAGEFQSQFNEAIRDVELDDLKNEFRNLKDQASAEKALADFSQMVETATVGINEPAGPMQPEPIKSEVQESEAQASEAVAAESPVSEPEAVEPPPKSPAVGIQP
jgi:sec-independent protein translocase protein TatB